MATTYRTRIVVNNYRYIVPTKPPVVVIGSRNPMNNIDKDWRK